MDSNKYTATQLLPLRFEESQVLYFGEDIRLHQIKRLFCTYCAPPRLTLRSDQRAHKSICLI